ncbi:AraC family transcriptional regulator [Enemella evansiae]|uniref:helix-turn-helix transcriptional regulator n=1 Tax=Enemella evansiae TaxID=2016499 RepID=UPI000B96D02A|nr:AraC family transcriptional regulator [Enemella evansiae]OYO10938.1 AraC family transcriptional regulator [Enemella evansiae]
MPTTARPEVLATLRFITEHQSEPLTLAEVADAVGYSPFHLARRFKAEVGLAPMQWLAAQRFLRARQLLLGSDASVTDICMEVGFSSLGTFTRRFTGEVGLGPSEFRRLPDRLHDEPARFAHVPGLDPAGGRLSGRIRFTEAARARVGQDPVIYIGLFAERAARGRPVCGSHLRGTDVFGFTDIPPGQYWLLASAYADDDPLRPLTDAWPVAGGTGAPVRIGRGLTSGQQVLMATPGEWATPITVALPALTAERTAARPPIPLPMPMHHGVWRPR